MLILGLTGGLILPDGTIAAGSAGVGKDTVADYLEEKYGWQKFAFSDQIYAEVAAAYGLDDESLLRDRETKDTESHLLALRYCTDPGFVETAYSVLHTQRLGYIGEMGRLPLSPRWVLQVWGTEYRRAQDALYWIKATDRWLSAQREVGYPEHRCQYYVNTTVRFENERDWIKNWPDSPWSGQLWHVRRPTTTAPPDHVSERLLPVHEGERELWNCGTIDTLYKAIDLLMTTSAPVVKALPLRVYVPTAEDIADARAQD